jgi:hypothetical protein
VEGRWEPAGQAASDIARRMVDLAHHALMVAVLAVRRVLEVILARVHRTQRAARHRADLDQRLMSPDDTIRMTQ